MAIAGIGQHFIGSADLGKHVMGLFLPFVGKLLIWMGLHSQLSIGFLNVPLVSVWRDTKDLIWIVG